MAEAAMFSVASKLLSTVSSPAFEIAYGRVCSIWDARKELDKLRRSIQTIQAVLLDAEKKQDSSAAVKDWIKRVRDVLYEADDFFDEVVTDDTLKKQIIKGGNKFLSKVRVSCSKLNPIVSRDSIAKKVKAIRKSLLEISSDMTPVQFVICQREAPVSGVRRGRDPGSFVDSKDVFGREEDKKTILDLLFNEPHSVKPDVPFVIAIVGIGGMGKSTLAQLIYSDEKVEKKFEKKWFVCISDTSDEKEVLGKIFQSMCDKNYDGFTISQLHTEIRKAMEGIKNFLLVLDDVWDEDHGRWQHRMNLLSNGSKGSKIIVTTRSLSVARGVGASNTHNLYGLSEDGSWDLFKKVAFTSEQERDSRWVDLGREIVKKCANVPLAIRSIGSLLYTKTTFQEWESFRDQELSKLDEQSGDSIMNTLRLSYEHLPSNLKHCFAYCSLFPKSFYFDVHNLIYFWAAQGYIKPHHDSQTVEQAGNSYFMDLLRRSFFQEASYVDEEVAYCKMHDLIHELAQCVAGEEICMVSRSSHQFKDSARHAGIVGRMDKSWEVLAQPLNINRVRSVWIDIADSGFLLTLEEQLTKFKRLRTLSLRRLGIKNVSSSIGELKHLRYVDLSQNPFESLPDSMANLLNLLVLNLRYCENLRALPNNFRKLINLRYLNIESCNELKHMPPGIEELTCLQYLSNFEVGEAIEGVQMSGLGALAKMQRLRGELCITFHMGINDWDEEECWQLPVSPRILKIVGYPGRRIPHWGNRGEIIDPSLLTDLAVLSLYGCSKVKYMPPICLLPNLVSLFLSDLGELEYMEEEEDEERDKNNSIGSTSGCSTNASTFFSRLEIIELSNMPKLKGWRRRKVVAMSTATEGHIALATLPLEDQHLHSFDPPLFPCLSQLKISSCPELKSIPLCPDLRKITFLKNVGIQQLMSSVGSNSSSLEQILLSDCHDITSFTDDTLTSLRDIYIWGCHNLTSLHLTSPHLQKITIAYCNGIMSIHVEALPTLLSLTIIKCKQLKNLLIACLNVLEKLEIKECPELELWDQDTEERLHLDWDSLPNFRELRVDTLPPSEKLPESLLRRQALGNFQVNTLEESKCSIM